MTSPQIIQQADDLKASVADTSSGSNEAWVARQALQDLYQKLLVIDLEFALDKKVEQDLWNHAFKNQITVLQNQAKDKQNPKRSEIQSSLNLFLETAGGFYLQLLQELCSAFKLDLPFRRKASNFGVLKEYDVFNPKMRVPKPSSSMYICQHCLVHLGDIARYRQQIDQAQSYYRHAAHLVPYNGQPYNQLAILEAAKSNKLATVFYYARSIAVKHPFPVASTNLDKFYTKISKETYDYRGKLSLSETIATFLQFHAFIHLDSVRCQLKIFSEGGKRLQHSDKARKHGERLILSLPTHVTSTSFSSYQLVQMVAINLFAIHKAQRGRVAEDENENNPHGTDNGNDRDPLDGAGDAETSRAFTIMFELIMSMLEQLVFNTPKQEQKAKDYHTLPALKVILDWLLSDTRVMAHTATTNSGIWANLSKLLNNLQFHGGQKDITFDPDKYVAAPLPEDCDLQCFLPVLKAHVHLDLSKARSDASSGEIEVRLRCYRLVELGRRIADDFSRLSLLTYTRLKSGRLQFSCPLGQVKILSGPDTERKASRQNNVAIQAIMQKKDNVQLVLKDLSADQTVRPGDIAPKRRLSAEDHHGDSNLKAHGEGRKQATSLQSQFTQPQQQYTQYTQYQQGYLPYQPLPYQQQQQGHAGGLVMSLNGGEQSQQQSAVTHESHSPGSLPPMGHLHLGGTSSGGQYGPLSGQGTAPQGMPGALRSMGGAGGGMVGYGMANGSSPRGSLDLSSASGPAQKSPFQPAPGSGLSAGSQPGMGPGPGGPFGPSQGGIPLTLVGHHKSMVNQPQMHSAASPARSALHPFPQSQSFPQNYPQNYPPPPGNQQYLGDGVPRGQPPYGNPDPSSRAVTMAGYLSSSPPDAIHAASPAYGSAFLGARVPSPQIMPSLNTTVPSILNLLNSSNLGLYAPPPAHIASPQQPVGGGSMDRFLHLGDEGDVGCGGFPPVGGGVGGGGGRFPGSGERGGEPTLMLQQEDFNKDEPELKFTDLTLEADTHFSPSSGFGLSGLTISDQTQMPQAESPNTGPLGSLFTLPADGVLGSQANTYSLFSKSPWTVQLSKPDSNKSLSSSPFGSGEDSGSVRNTPDPFSDMADVQKMSTGFPLGYAFGSPDSSWTNQPAASRPEERIKSGNLLSSSIQSLWSPGPSPLEKLLEQQKQQQRHCDPH